MSKLKSIAADMRHVLLQTNARYVYRRMGRGLEIVLQRTGRQYRLAIARTDTAPSDVEIETCQDAFCVPAGAAINRTEKTRQGKTGIIRHHVAEITWFEEEPTHAA